MDLTLSQQIKIIGNHLSNMNAFYIATGKNMESLLRIVRKKEESLNAAKLSKSCTFKRKLTRLGCFYVTAILS